MRYYRFIFIYLLYIYHSNTVFAENSSIVVFKEEYDNNLGLIHQLRYQNQNQTDIDVRYMQSLPSQDNYVEDDAYMFALETPYWQIGVLNYSGLLRQMNSPNLLSSGILYEKTKTKLNRSAYTKVDKNNTRLGVNVFTSQDQNIAGFVRLNDNGSDSGLWYAFDFFKFSSINAWASHKENVDLNENEDWLFEENDFLGGNVNVVASQNEFDLELLTAGLTTEMSLPEVGSLKWRFTPYLFHRSKWGNLSFRYMKMQQDFLSLSTRKSKVLDEWNFDADINWFKYFRSTTDLMRSEYFEWEQGISYFNKYGGGKVLVKEKQDEKALLEHSYELKLGSQQYLRYQLFWQEINVEKQTWSASFYVLPQTKLKLAYSSKVRDDALAWDQFIKDKSLSLDDWEMRLTYYALQWQIYFNLNYEEEEKYALWPENLRLELGFVGSFRN